MREFDALKSYPQPKQPREVSSTLRTIKSRIIAGYRDREYYDGDRNNGYGGFKYDGRWLQVAKDMCEEYNLNNKSSVLIIGAEKGFLVHDFKQLYPEMNVIGIDISKYAYENSMDDIKKCMRHVENYTKIDFPDRSFDFVAAIGVIYPLILADGIKCLKEIERVGKGKSFITLGSFRTEREYWLFRYWTVLGWTVLHEDDWVEVLKHVKYRGDYKFMNARVLNLVEKKN